MPFEGDRDAARAAYDRLGPEDKAAYHRMREATIGLRYGVPGLPVLAAPVTAEDVHTAVARAVMQGLDTDRAPIAIVDGLGGLASPTGRLFRDADFAVDRSWSVLALLDAETGILHDAPLEADYGEIEQRIVASVNALVHDAHESNEALRRVDAVPAVRMNRHARRADASRNKRKGKRGRR